MMSLTETLNVINQPTNVMNVGEKVVVVVVVETEVGENLSGLAHQLGVIEDLVNDVVLDHGEAQMILLVRGDEIIANPVTERVAGEEDVDVMILLQLDPIPAPRLVAAEEVDRIDFTNEQSFVGDGK